MKNKIIVIGLVLILGLSSTSALAVERGNYRNFNFYDLFMNMTSYNYEDNYTNTQTIDRTKTTENTPAFRRSESNTYVENSPLSQTIEAPSSEAPRQSVSQYEERVAELVNIERQKNGLGPLTLDSAISNVARIKSKDMSDNNYFAHQSPTYGSAADMLRQHGIRYSAWGENIAAGQNTPESVVRAWMNSEGHKANILSPHFSKIGVGYINNGRPYWTQMFTN